MTFLLLPVEPRNWGKKAPKEEHLLSGVCEHSVCLWQRSGEGRRSDTEKMNSGILNIKDDRVPQQLLLFIFLRKHLDTHIHLYSCHTPSFSPSPSVSSCHSLFFSVALLLLLSYLRLHVNQPQVNWSRDVSATHFCTHFLSVIVAKNRVTQVLDQALAMDHMWPIRLFEKALRTWRNNSNSKEVSCKIFAFQSFFSVFQDNKKLQKHWFYCNFALVPPQ